MPIGVQFGNLNEYRRYPFADDTDLTCTCTAGSSVFRFDLPISFLTAFRFVHVGSKHVSSVYLTQLSYSSLSNSFNIGLKVCDKDGNPIGFMCKGAEVQTGDPLLLTLSTIGETSGLYKISDFDFSNCITIYLDVDVKKLRDTVAEVHDPSFDGSFSIICNIRFAPAAVFSLREPYVMSVLDDNGSPIRDCESIELVAGYNTKIDVLPDSNTFVVSALLGAGKGFPVNESGLSKDFSGTRLKVVNGVSADLSGNIKLIGGYGIVVNPIDGTNIVNIYSDKEDQSSMECELK